MPYRIVDAREQVLEHLDDESGERYARETGSNTTSYRKLYRHVKNAASTCLDTYVKRGGDRFDELLECSTSASTGKVDLAQEQLLHIRAVRIDTGVAKYRVTEGDNLAGGLPDLVERDLELTVVRKFELPQDPDEDDLLMGTVNGAARSWDAFDEWVCAVAADSMGAKDDETRQALQRTIARCEKAVLSHKRTPASMPWPEKGADSLYLSGRLRWLWHAREQDLALVFGRR